jgi:hypothetical protein
MKCKFPFLLPGLIAVTSLVGCGKSETQPKDAPVAPTKTDATPPEKIVSWFMSNRDEMKRALLACNDNPGMLAAKPDCVNASAARDTLIVQEMNEALKGGGK